MKLLIIRHGDPYYEIDSLTQKGWKEAEYLSEKLCGLDVKAFLYVTVGAGAGYGKAHPGKAGKNCRGEGMAAGI